MIKKIIFAFALLSASCLTAGALDFSKADALLHSSEEYRQCRTLLDGMLKEAAPGHEKSEVLWRLARICMLNGENETDVQAKKKAFGEGKGFAEKGMEADPSNHQCYMWHCANVGRECQLGKLTEQIAAVPIMENDLSTILEKLHKTSFSEAWQAMAEIYFNHPFKSTDSAISFMRKALADKPAGELRMTNYLTLATMLHSRGDNAKTRNDKMSKSADKYSKSQKSAIEKYSFFEGAQGPAFKPAWSGKPLGELSDREEASLIATYAISLYGKAKDRTPLDTRDYQSLKQMMESWK